MFAHWHISVAGKKQTTFYMATCRPKDIFYHISFFSTSTGMFTKRIYSHSQNTALLDLLVYENSLWKAIIANYEKNPNDKFVLTICKNLYPVESNNISFLKM